MPTTIFLSCAIPSRYTKTVDDDLVSQVEQNGKQAAYADSINHCSAEHVGALAVVRDFAFRMASKLFLAASAMHPGSEVSSSATQKI